MTALYAVSLTSPLVSSVLQFGTLLVYTAEYRVRIPPFSATHHYFQCDNRTIHRRRALFFGAVLPVGGQVKFKGVATASQSGVRYLKGATFNFFSAPKKCLGPRFGTFLKADFQQKFGV